MARDWLRSSEPDFFRLHLTRPPASEHDRVSASYGLASLGRLVPALRGGNLVQRLASSFTNRVTAEPGDWKCGGSSRHAATQLFRHRAVDGLSAVCPIRTSDHG